MKITPKLTHSNTLSLILHECDMHARMTRYIILMALVKESDDLVGT
jgi:hypothetical protein